LRGDAAAPVERPEDKLLFDTIGFLEPTKYYSRLESMSGRDELLQPQATLSSGSLDIP
jgi:hypothetical protein